MRYHLSNSQQRDLAKGSAIWIALPDRVLSRSSPDATTADLVYVGSVLDVDPSWVRRVEPRAVYLSPDLQYASEGLTGTLGHLSDSLPETVLGTSCRVLAVLLSSRKELRPKPGMRWPYSVTIETPGGTRTFPEIDGGF